MNIKEALKQINIDGKKAELYLACLEMKGATAYALAKKVGLKRPTAYDVLGQLLKEGLVYRSIKKQAGLFYPADPDRLLKKIKEKEETIKAIMPTLQDLYNSSGAKPVIKYFEGKEGIKEMYDDSLKVLRKGEEILAYVGEDVLSHLPEHAASYVKERVAKGIRLRGLYKKSGTIMKYMEKNREQLRTAKILEENIFPLNNEINIYKNKIAIASYGKEMFGIIIESEEIARAQKAIFELAWRGTDRVG